MRAEATSRLSSIVVTQQTLVAYNLTVSGLHTYFASDKSVLVHNDTFDISGPARRTDMPR